MDSVPEDVSNIPDRKFQGMRKRSNPNECLAAWLNDHAHIKLRSAITHNDMLGDYMTEDEDTVI